MFRFLIDFVIKKASPLKEGISRLNDPLEERRLSSSLDQNIAVMKELFCDVDVLRYREIKSRDGSLRYYLVYCDGMVNVQVINDNIVKPLMLSQAGRENFSMETLLSCVVQVSESKTTDSFKSIIQDVTYGDTVLFAEGSARAAILNTKQFLLRSVAEPDNEKTLSGPREGFTESLMQNVSQIRKRARTQDLKIKTFFLGRRTQTTACLCYFDSLVNKDVLKEVFSRLEKVDIDGVLDTNYINELIRDQRYTPFRSTNYTERPDVVIGKLLEGRIAIFLDGTPAVLTVPYLFIENFQSNEDYYLNYYYTSFARILRIAAFFLTVAVPGLYIAVVGFHQEMLPTPLLISLAVERQKAPLPAAFEALVMLLAFDILRETGIRMPSNVGQALSIVGALVIGQAAVEAELVAAPMIIVVAITGITSLLIPKLNTPIIFWRLFLLLLASSFGFFGLTVGLSALLIYINGLTSFGVEQLTLDGSFRPQAGKDLLIRAPWQLMHSRPERLTRDRTRQSGGK